jgi:hypothetical protein
MKDGKEIYPSDTKVLVYTDETGSCGVHLPDHCVCYMDMYELSQNVELLPLKEFFEERRRKAFLHFIGSKYVGRTKEIIDSFLKCNVVESIDVDEESKLIKGITIKLDDFYRKNDINPYGIKKTDSHLKVIDRLNAIFNSNMKNIIKFKIDYYSKITYYRIEFIDNEMNINVKIEGHYTFLEQYNIDKIILSL